MVVSHRGGRKCATVFTRREAWGRYSLWEARTGDNRPHQVRIHAAESRLRIPGEHLYVRVRLPYLSALKRDYRPGSGDEQPLHGPLCLHLREVRFPAPDGSIVTVEAPRPRSFSALLSCLARYG
jgi:23S rRNA-/tRNA-specific pseudouridylate synthase